jgi:hypothetical protein
MKLKQDKFRKRRGDSSRLLDLKCGKCNQHLFFYQKDGSGIIKRLYLDRIYPATSKGKQLLCAKCKEVVGTLIIYKKENRLAYRIFVGAINKQIVPASYIK